MQVVLRQGHGHGLVGRCGNAGGLLLPQPALGGVKTPLGQQPGGHQFISLAFFDGVGGECGQTAQCTPQADFFFTPGKVAGQPQLGQQRLPGSLRVQGFGRVVSRLLAQQQPGMTARAQGGGPIARAIQHIGISHQP